MKLFLQLTITALLFPFNQTLFFFNFNFDPLCSPPLVTGQTSHLPSGGQRGIRFNRLKYSISVVADKGLKKANYTPSCLKKGEGVLSKHIFLQQVYIQSLYA